LAQAIFDEEPKKPAYNKPGHVPLFNYLVICILFTLLFVGLRVPRCCGAALHPSMALGPVGLGHASYPGDR
jgi:hypothetical protein